MINKINACRICGNKQLIKIIDLGEQTLTGIFNYPDDVVDKAPLVLVKCHDAEPDKCCGLVQLLHTYDLSKMYGEQYGYRSSLNSSMAAHLQTTVSRILELDISLDTDDLIIDIGSNDGTTLNCYPETKAQLIGVDPTAKYFKSYYKEHISIIDDFFSADKIKQLYPGKKAKIITSFSMFYDLEAPQKFTDEIAELLDDEGVWVCEQSYLPLMLKNNSFDTICHEHLEYYAFRQIQWMFRKAGLKVIDIQLNTVNGGSFCIYATKITSHHPVNSEVINKIIANEDELQLSTLKPYNEFCSRIELLKNELIEKLVQIKSQGKTVYGLGASTKGNVLLQYYNLDRSLIASIGEVNSDKFGKVTPGSNIPIEDESLVLEKMPDYLLILPWHFKSFFQNNPKFQNTCLLFPLPQVEEIS
ncbi:methyltransferase [Legionella moravica]|uniref:Methyltransferase n=1 Tax=Legionella moravica TaxID=39962 RepID=A0A378JZI4_9GAMM|nr:class I SAM-dependent methyltransferase [Legionella moravica]KTD30736.1 methyltransferase [Legionella moravica]STX63440.1 methyltransferase [Legionella moravica]